MALNIDNTIYESHPGYGEQIYISKECDEKVKIKKINGIQKQFTLSTFKNDAIEGSSSNVTEVDEIPIDENLAKRMQAAIESKNAAYGRLNFNSLDGIIQTLSADAQKGGNGTFTCVGLLEWAAEQDGGEGFIPNKFEKIQIPNPLDPSQNLIDVPTPISPQLLYNCIKNQNIVDEMKQWLIALFDPVDFIITDPLGRKLGFVNGSGGYQEIPQSFYSGDGTYEQVMIMNAIPGTYKIHMVGVGKEAFAGLSSLGSSESFQGQLANGQIVDKTLVIKATVGCSGDVNLDGLIDEKDIVSLKLKLNSPATLNDPGDIDRDGMLTDTDLKLLKQLLVTILPVRIGQLTLQKATEGTCKLNWKSYDEQDILHFEIQHAINGTDFKTIGKVNTASNNGAILTEANYQFLHSNPSKGDNYYRIIAMGIDQQQIISNTVHVKFDFDFTIEIYPNPATSQTNIKILSEISSSLTIQLLDINGKLLWKKKESLKQGMNQVSIPSSQWPAGIYILQITLNNGEQRTLKLIK